MTWTPDGTSTKSSGPWTRSAASTKPENSALPIGVYEKNETGGRELRGVVKNVQTFDLGG